MVTAQQTKQTANPSATQKDSRAPFFSPAFIQPKLSINAPGDIYEQEADSMADSVMRKSDDTSAQQTFFKPSITHVQRKCSHCEEEEKLQRKESNNDATVANTTTESYISSLHGKGRSLTNNERSFFEPKFGYDFSDVQLHTDNSANQSAQSINALAYTHSNDIVFSAGQYQPETETGKKLMAHELTHVVQQSSNSVQPKTIQCEGNGDLPSLSFLGPLYYKEEKDIPLKDKAISGTILSPSPLPADFVLHNIHKPGGTEPLQSLIPASKFYKIAEGEYYHQVWAKQANEDAKWFFWGWVNPKYLSYDSVEKIPSSPANNQADEDIIPDEFKRLMQDQDSIEGPVVLPTLSEAMIKSFIRANLEGNVAMHKLAIQTIEQVFAEDGKTDQYKEFLTDIGASDWDAAATHLAGLSSEEMQLLFSQLNLDQLGELSISIEAPDAIDAMSAFMFLYEEVDSSVREAQSAEQYDQAIKDGDWQTAAKILSGYSDGVIVIKLNSLTEEQLRAMRKGADVVSAPKVTEISTAIISQKSRADVAVENILNQQWGLNFFLGLYDAGLGDVFGKSWEAMKADYTAFNSLKFNAGFSLGMDVGVLEDLWDNIKGLAEIVWLLTKTQVRLAYEPYEVLKEMYGVLKGLFGAALFALDGREIGYHVGRYIGTQITKEFIEQGYFDRGWFLGKMLGKLLTEIALALVGVEEIAAVSKAVKATSLFMKIGEALGKSEKLKLIMEALPKLRLAKGAETAADASKISELAKGISALEDVPKMEKALTEMAKYEKEAGSLVSKEMKALEETVLKEKIKDPTNIKEVTGDLAKNYNAEIKTAEPHTYRRKFDGTWCRFSDPECGVGVAKEVEEATAKLLQKRLVGTFDELAKFRKEIGLPPASMEKGNPTLARLDISGNHTYGTNWNKKATQPSRSIEEIAKVKEFVKEAYGTAPHQAVMEHAEADAIIDAFSKSYTAEHAVLYVDKPLCGFCDGSLRRLLPLLDLKSITVYELGEKGVIRTFDILAVL